MAKEACNKNIRATAVAWLALASCLGVTHALSPFRKPCENAFTTKDTCGDDEAGFSNGFKIAVIVGCLVLLSCLLVCIICYKCKDMKAAKERKERLEYMSRGVPAAVDPAILEAMAAEKKALEMRKMEAK